MFDESYENYIRSILGYPTYGMMSDMMGCSNCDYVSSYTESTNHRELEECYPEIYKLIFPMVKKTCDSLQEPITRELVDKLTDNIYFAIEGNDEVNININLSNEVRNNSSSRENRQEKAEEKGKQERETRSPRPINHNLRDLIKILLLRELLNRPGHRPLARPPRPPFPGGPGPGRPPFPGYPGGPSRPPFHGGPGRPSIMPRAMDDYNLYEN